MAERRGKRGTLVQPGNCHPPATPTTHKDLWAYDMFYGHVHLAVWHGGTCDDGTPRIESKEENRDDYHLRLYVDCKIPHPSKKQIQAAFEDR